MLLSAWPPLHDVHRRTSRSARGMQDEPGAGLSLWNAESNLLGENLVMGPATREAARDEMLGARSPWRTVFAGTRGVSVRKVTGDKRYGEGREIDQRRRSEIAKRKTSDTDFEAWVDSMLDDVWGSPYIEIGRKKVPYSLDSVVAAMTKQRSDGRVRSRWSIG